jgi:hypothetical protein
MARRSLAVLVLLLVLAGCGGSGGGGGKSVSGDPIALAAAKTSRVGSVEADFSLSGSGTKGHGNGVFNTGARPSGQLTMSVTSGGQDLKIDTVISGNVLYIRSPTFAGLSGGKQWVKIDLAVIARQRGIDLSSLLKTSPTPASALAYLRGSGGQVRRVGSDSVRGVETTHYKVTVDLERAAKRADGDARQSLRSVIQLSGVRKLPVDVWLDGDGYVRKVVYSSPGRAGQRARVTMELHDFGKRVTIKPPPSGSVIDLMNLLQQQQGG